MFQSRWIKGKKYLTIVKGNTSYGCIGASGFGKTVFSEKIVELHRSMGYKIIYVFDPKDDCEAAFMGLKPIYKKHIARLHLQGQDPDREPYKVRVNHPISRSVRTIPFNQIPETNFFTIPINSFTDDDIKFLLEDFGEDEKYALFENVLAMLTPQDSAYHFRLKMKMSRERQDIMLKHKNMVKDDFDSLDDGSYGKIDRADRINNILKPFVNDGFITPGDYHLNIDIPKILNDRDVIDIFSCRYLKKGKEKAFVGFWVLDKIFRALPKAKYPVLIVFPELRRITPRHPKGYERILSKKIADLLKTVRSLNCSVVADAQAVSMVDEDVINSFVEKAYGRLAAGAETSYYYKTERMPSIQVEALKRCDRGQFIISSLVKEGLWNVDLPTHLHSEEEIKYDTVFRQQYPERMYTYKPLVTEFRKDCKNMLKSAHKMKKEQDDHEKKIKQRKEKKFENKDKNKLIEIEQEVKLKKEEEKLRRDEIIREVVRQTDGSGNQLTIPEVQKELATMGIPKVGKDLIRKYRKQENIIEPKETVEEIIEIPEEKKTKKKNSKWV